MSIWPWSPRPAAPENPGRALAEMSKQARAERLTNDRARFRAMARELCNITGQPVPAALENDNG